jgi:hypothetical protein
MLAVVGSARAGWDEELAVGPNDRSQNRIGSRNGSTLGATSAGSQHSLTRLNTPLEQQMESLVPQ